MTKEVFEQDRYGGLKEASLPLPGMRPEDIVKFVLQGLPGGGPLVSSQGVSRLLITLDGPCASGKTTLARKLAQVFHGEVIHTDDYVIPHAQKTPERLAVPGGNCDAERLVREVVAPFKQGNAVSYRRYDCMKDILLPEERLPDTGVLILEGSYCNLPAIREYADVRLFLDAPWEIREARLLARESAASMRRFLERWIPLENAYFEAYHLPDEGNILISVYTDSVLKHAHL